MRVLFLTVFISFWAFALMKGNCCFSYTPKVNAVDTPPPYPYDLPPPPKTQDRIDRIECYFGEIPILPSFVGGDSARIEYLKRNIKVDYERYNDSFPRKVWVRITIDTLGNVVKPKIVKGGLDSSFNTYIINAFLNMPRWLPAEEYGKPLEMDVIVPLKYSRKED